MQCCRRKFTKTATNGVQNLLFLLFCRSLPQSCHFFLENCQPKKKNASFAQFINKKVDSSSRSEQKHNRFTSPRRLISPRIRHFYNSNIQIKQKICAITPKYCECTKSYFLLHLYLFLPPCLANSKPATCGWISKMSQSSLQQCCRCGSFLPHVAGFEFARQGGRNRYRCSRK